MKAVMELRKMPLRGVLFFSGMFVFVWLAVEPRLIYHSFGMFFGYPEFSTGWAFFKEVVAAPGGVVEYVAGFLSQWFCISWIGAGVITMSAWSFYYLTGSLAALCGGRRDNILCYLPAIGLTAAYSAYSHPLNLCLAMLTSLLFVVVYERIPFRRNVSKGAVFAVLAAVLYYIAGGASVFFVVLAAACEIVIRRRVRFGLVMLAVGLAAGRLVIFCLVDIPVRQAYSILLPIHPETAKQTGPHSAVLVSGLYCFVILFVLLMAYYLLTGRHEKITENIRYFRELGYDKIPRCCEEAIVLDIAMSGKQPNLHGWTISNRTAQRYEAFNSVGRDPMYSGLDQRALGEVLARDFADTYFFYYLFGLSRLSK